MAMVIVLADADMADERQVNLAGQIVGTAYPPFAQFQQQRQA